MRVTVDSEALDRFIGYAEGLRMARDSEFACSTEDWEDSQIEFDGSYN